MHRSPTVLPSFLLSTECDPRLRVASALVASERMLGRRLRCVDEVYGQHLRRLSSVTQYEHQILFDSVAPIITLSDQLVESVSVAHYSYPLFCRKIFRLPSSFNFILYINPTKG